MKKIIILLTPLFILCLAPISWAANSSSAVATAKVHVESVFEIGLDRNDIDFESMKPGELKYDIPASGIKVSTKSNTGKKWYLMINNLSELRDGDRFIDNKNFSWYGWTEGQGKWFGTGEDTFKLTPVTAYESSTIEGLNFPKGTNNLFKFKLRVPANQSPGNYETTVRFTVTE